MANPFAGEVDVVIDGAKLPMKLTLGALAELEAGLSDGNFMDLVARFETGRFSPGDVLSLIVAGLRGCGWTGTTNDLTHAEIGEGPLDAARLAGLLLSRAFTVPGCDDG